MPPRTGAASRRTPIADERTYTGVVVNLLRANPWDDEASYSAGWEVC
jgi:hypothetical protein